MSTSHSQHITEAVLESEPYSNRLKLESTVHLAKVSKDFATAGPPLPLSLAIHRLLEPITGTDATPRNPHEDSSLQHPSPKNITDYAVKEGSLCCRQGVGG
jgi:hypothetical protein